MTASFEEFVHDFHVFFGYFVAVIVRCYIIIKRYHRHAHCHYAKAMTYVARH